MPSKPQITCMSQTVTLCGSKRSLRFCKVQAFSDSYHIMHAADWQLLPPQTLQPEEMCSMESSLEEQVMIARHMGI